MPDRHLLNLIDTVQQQSAKAVKIKPPLTRLFWQSRLGRVPGTLVARQQDGNITIAAVKRLNHNPVRPTCNG